MELKNINNNEEKRGYGDGSKKTQFKKGQKPWNTWHKYPVGLDRDHIRTKELLNKGFKVLRLWECEIRPMNINNFKIKLEEVKN